MSKLELMADYFQIYITDPERLEDWSALWTDQAVDDRIIALAHSIVFGTGRNMPVPVDVIVHERQPDLATLVGPADHAVAASITCASGQLKIAGCTDYLPDAFALAIPPGSYAVACLTFDLGTIEPVYALEAVTTTRSMSGQPRSPCRPPCSSDGKAPERRAVWN